MVPKCFPWPALLPLWRGHLRQTSATNLSVDLDMELSTSIWLFLLPLDSYQNTTTQTFPSTDTSQIKSDIANSNGSYKEERMDKSEQPKFNATNNEIKRTCLCVDILLFIHTFFFQLSQPFLLWLLLVCLGRCFTEKEIVRSSTTVENPFKQVAPVLKLSQIL